MSNNNLNIENNNYSIDNITPNNLIETNINLSNNDLETDLSNVNNLAHNNLMNANPIESIENNLKNIELYNNN